MTLGIPLPGTQERTVLMTLGIRLPGTQKRMALMTLGIRLPGTQERTSLNTHHVKSIDCVDMILTKRRATHAATHTADITPTPHPQLPTLTSRAIQYLSIGQTTNCMRKR